MYVYEIKEHSILRFDCALAFVVRYRWNKEDFERAQKYAELIQVGVLFPPIQYVYMKGYHVMDGYHRLYANRLLNRKTIQAVELPL